MYALFISVRYFPSKPNKLFPILLEMVWVRIVGGFYFHNQKIAAVTCPFVDYNIRIIKPLSQ